MSTLITCLQLFGIGFSFNIVGPCLLVCGPILLTYVTGNRKGLRASISDVLIFSFGRLSAYTGLGYLAGVSGEFLRRLSGSSFGIFFKPFAGVISVILGLIILFNNGGFARHQCQEARGTRYGTAGLFLLGLAQGAVPCPPLTALLFEIALMSKNAIHGAAYALAFGLGTFLSGLLVFGAISGAMSVFAKNILISKEANIVFKFSSAILLILLGISLII
jgi:sulfite exporter TauE/SafE